MPATYSFDFGHKFLPIRDWLAAFLVFSEDNVYTPDPDTLTVTPKADGMSITAPRYAWAGLQQHAPGTFAADIRYIDGGFDCTIRATMHERIKGTTLLLRVPFPKRIPTKDLGEADCPAAGAELNYPSTLRLPVCPLRHADGSYTTLLSLDERFRRKVFAIVPEGDTALLELHHHEDARQWSLRQETPTWRVTRSSDPTPALATRREIMERTWGLRSWEERADVPAWMRQIGLVLNLHGTHWTGYIFNTYAQQLAAIQHVAQRLEGRRILAYLAAWDGRYNYNWPRYEADERMGGAAGLKKLVEGAHALGVHVIPQIGGVSANRRFLPPALHDCASQDAFGNTYVKDLDWDNDRAGDTYRVNANIGHPGFRQFLLDKTFHITDQFGFDGIFIDINQHFFNDTRFSIVEGHHAFAAGCHARLKNYLVFGETWYDALLPAYPLVHSVNAQGAGYPHRWPEIFDRYARTTHHLIHPAPGNGSTGVYEAGFKPVFEPDPNLNVIPCLSFIDDTLRQHGPAIDRHVEIAKAYIRRMGI